MKNLQWIILVPLFLFIAILLKAESPEFNGEYRKIVLTEFPGYRVIDFLEVAPNVYFVCLAAYQRDVMPEGILLRLSVGDRDYSIELLHSDANRIIYHLNKKGDRVCVVILPDAPGINGIDEFSLLCYDFRTGEESKTYSPPFQFVSSVIGSTVQIEMELYVFFSLRSPTRLAYTVWDMENGNFLRWGTISGGSPTLLTGVSYCDSRDAFLVYIIHGIIEVSRDMVAINYLSREDIGHNYSGRAVCMPNGNILVGGSESGDDWLLEERPILQMAKISLFDSEWNLIRRDSFPEFQGYVNGFWNPPKIDFERRAVYANPGFGFGGKMMRCDSDFSSIVARYDFELNPIWSVFYDSSTQLQPNYVVPISIGCAVVGAKLDCEDGEPTFYPFIKLFDETTVHVPEEPAEVWALNIMGNPGGDELTLSLESPGAERIKAEIYNTTGQLMAIHHLSHGLNTIDASQWPSGMYIIRAIMPESANVWSGKWLKGN